MNTVKPKSLPKLLDPAAAQRSSAGLVAEAERLLAQGHIDPGLNLLHRALAADPASAAAHNLLAIACVMQGDAEAGLKHANAATQLRPDDARLWFTLGRAHKAAGALADAVVAYRRAIDLQPQYAQAHVSLGIALSAQGELDAAIAAYQQAIQLQPQLAVAHANLGNALAARAERAILAGSDAAPSDEAIAAQARAAEIDPHNATLQRIVSHRELGTDPLVEPVMSAETLGELAKADELEVIYAHLASLRNFGPMVERIGATGSAAQADESPVA